MRLLPIYRTKRLVLATSQVVVGNCREFDVVITDEQLVINKKQTWRLPADHIWRFEPRAAIDDDILRCSIRDNMRWPQFVANIGFPVCVVFCLVPPESAKRALGPGRFFPGSPGAGVSRGRSSGELADENGPAAPREVALKISNNEIAVDSRDSR